MLKKNLTATCKNLTLRANLRGPPGQETVLSPTCSPGQRMLVDAPEASGHTAVLQSCLGCKDCWPANSLLLFYQVCLKHCKGARARIWAKCPSALGHCLVFDAQPILRFFPVSIHFDSFHFSVFLQLPLNSTHLPHLHWFYILGLFSSGYNSYTVGIFREPDVLITCVSSF